MNILLYQDNTLDLSLHEIASKLNHRVKSIHFEIGRDGFAIAGDFVSNPTSYQQLSQALLREISSSDGAILLTLKPYDNNYFFDTDDDICIVSFYGWEHLTNLPITNGLVYFIASIISDELVDHYSHGQNTGCINDFWMDKTGVDGGMRAAFICAQCEKRMGQRLMQSRPELVSDLQVILDDVSKASRKNTDILALWNKLDEERGGFDVFLCHNGDDKPDVRLLAEELSRRGVRVWLDEEQCRPGLPWQDVLEQSIASVRSAAICLGSSGFGPWQEVESRAFLSEFLRRQCPVIPVILASAQEVPQLPLFLQQLTWVDFRKKHPDPWERLLWGITGTRPR
jgi:hypothetical protein